MIEVGDKVKIVDPEETYYPYSGIFIELGFKNRQRNESWEEGEEGTVFAKETHRTTGEIMLAVRHEDGRECLIGVGGVEKVRAEVKKERGKVYIKDLKEDDRIHAPTKDIARKLHVKLDELGYRWRSERSYLEVFQHAGKGTVYYPYNGTHGNINQRSTGNTYTIEDLADFDEPETKLYTIKDLARGECAVANDGSVEDLGLVLAKAFPITNTKIYGKGTYYFRDPLLPHKWSSGHTKLPKQSVKDFIKQIDMKEENKKDGRFPFKLNVEQVNKIYGIACGEWKDKLRHKWGSEFMEGASVTVEEDFYKTMRKACTASQHELFDEIFGKDEPECPYEDGELIFVRDDMEPWRLRYSNGKMDKQGRVEAYLGQKRSGRVFSYKKHAKAPNVKLPE